MKKTSLMTSGQSLIETIVALTVAVLIISALVAGVVVSVRNARFAKNQSLATKFAQEGIEETRLYRDQNGWEAFWTAKIDPGTPETDTPDSIYTRTITYENMETSPDAADRAKVVVTVQWSEAGKTHQSRLITYLSRWE